MLLAMPCPEDFRSLPAIVQREIVIAGSPWIIQGFTCVLLKQLASTVIQIVEGLAQGKFPTAISLGTPTTSIPTIYAMCTAPRTWLTNLHFLGCRVHTHIGFKRADLKAMIWCTMVDKVGEEFVTPRLMMPIEFTISGNENQLWFTSLLLALDDLSFQVS